jgi:ABC-type maltose transport system permease subunit
MYSKIQGNAVNILAMLPIVAVYAFCQKYFIEGIALGGVKG